MRWPWLGFKGVIVWVVLVAAGLSVLPAQSAEPSSGLAQLPDRPTLTPIPPPANTSAPANTPAPRTTDAQPVVSSPTSTPTATASPRPRRTKTPTPPPPTQTPTATQTRQPTPTYTSTTTATHTALPTLTRTSTATSTRTPMPIAASTTAPTFTIPPLCWVAILLALILLIFAFLRRSRKKQSPQTPDGDRDHHPEAGQPQEGIS